MLPHSLDSSTLPLIRTSSCWVLSKAVSSTIFKVFGMNNCFRVFLFYARWFPCGRNIIYINVCMCVCVCVCGWVGAYVCHHHHIHHVVPLAWISLIFSRHFSQSFFAYGRSSGLHPVSSHSCCCYVRAGTPPFVRPYVGVHMSILFMSSSLLLQQCPACLVRLTWIVFVMGGRWPYSWYIVGCCCQDLFNIARNILV